MTQEISQAILSQQIKEATVAKIQQQLAEAEIQGKYQSLQYSAFKALENLGINLAEIIYRLREADVENCSLCTEEQVRTAFLIWFFFFIEQEMDSVVSNVEQWSKNFRKHLEYPPEPLYQPTEQELEDASDFFDSVLPPLPTEPETAKVSA